MVEFGRTKKPSQDRKTLPSFADIVGQEELKQALLAVAVDDALDGLLIRGEKGTAKSTAVRALAALLPTQRAVADCPYGCPADAPDQQCRDCEVRDDPPVIERPVPLVTLPLGASRDRVVGTLSVASALDGDHQFDPGLLARANRGLLYVDEVNLLDDHLVDVLLDAAASGVNHVERDGVSVTHPAAFTLIGTMNPEEGDLRPQLRDRFALQATVTGCTDIDDRVEIIERALERDQTDSCRSSDGTARRERERQLQAARDRLDDVTLPEEFAVDIAEMCRDVGVEGHRADIATARAARSFAALNGRTKVVQSDLRRAAELSLPHRLKSRPFEDAPDPQEVVDEHFDDGRRESGESEGDDPGEGNAEAEDSSDSDGEDRNQRDSSGEDSDDRDDDSPRKDETGGTSEDESLETDRTDAGTPAGGMGGGPEADDEKDESSGDSGDDDREDGEPEDTVPLVPGQERPGIGDGRAPDLDAPEATAAGRPGGSRSQQAPDADNEGARVRTRYADSTADVDVAASLRAAARRGDDTLESRDLRQSVRAGDASALVLFVVDASASMRPAMRAAKGTVLDLLEEAYQERDQVGFVAFAGDHAEVVLPPTDSVTLAARHLKELPTGDRTPLPAGLRTAGEVIRRADPGASVVVLVTDGRANVAQGSPTRATREAATGLAELGAHVVVVDAGDGGRTGVTDLVIKATDGERVPLSSLSAERIETAVGDTTSV